jgi:ribonuclease VapC
MERVISTSCWQKLRVDIAAVTAAQADIARKAFRRYGRGRHAANLNFGL